MKKLILSALMLVVALSGAAPAYAQGVAPERNVSGGTSNAPPGDSGGGFAGTVTEISGSVVLVEEDPSSDSGDKGYFTVTEETEITRLVGGDAVVPAAFGDLAVGQTVEAAYAGPVMESYPSQGDAASIAILGDDPSPPPEEVSATGVLEPTACAPVVGDAPCQYGITDEATGTFYALTSDAVDLDAYAGDGRRVAVYGTPLETLVATEYPVLNVTRIEPLDGGGNGEESVAVAFELAVEGEPPADATFFASLGYEPAYFLLSDPDGDGLYAATTPEGLVSAGDVLPARILQGTGTRSSQVSGTAPGEPVGTIKDFGEVRFDEDTTLSAEVSFDGEEPPPPDEEITATGILEKLEAEPVVVDGVEICGLSTHAVTDEATGRYYDLTSDAVDLDAHIGERVAVTGTPLGSPAIEGAERCPDLNVTRVEVLDGGSEPPPPGDTATFAFELAVECEPPAGASFFGRSAFESFVSAPLADPDGDGVYVGSMTVPATSAGQGGPQEPLSLPVQVVQGAGTQGPDARGPLRPGEPIRVIRDFGTVAAEDGTFEASVSFCDGDNGGPDDGDGGGDGPGPVVGGTANGDATGGDEGVEVPGGGGPNGGASERGGLLGGIKTLPATGGAWAVAGLAGLALVAGGLLVRGIFR